MILENQDLPQNGFNLSPIKRILLCRLGGIGDVIHTLPLAKYLRREFKSASIEYLTGENIADLINKNCPFIDKVWIFNKSKKQQTANQILSNKTKIDYFFNLHSSFSLFLFNLFYIRARKYFHYKKDKNLHAVINFAKTYKKTISAFDIESKVLLIDNPKDILEKYNLKPNKYVCFVLGVGNVRAHRAWPFEKWMSLTKKYLTYEKENQVVFLGGKDEKIIFENWLKLVIKINAYKDINGLEKPPGFNGRALNLTGILGLSDVAKVISESLCVVSCDTGLLHIASALSKRVIGIYGPTLPERSGPFCGDYEIIKAKNCACVGFITELKKCIKTKDPAGFCMNNLSIEEVLSKISYNLVQI